MAEFRFTTSGDMTITLEGLQFGEHMRDPRSNVKSFIAHPTQIVINAADQKEFTGLGVIQLLDLNPGQRGYMTVSIDSPTMGWYGTAQVAVIVNGQNIINDNFQSGVKGPLGDPRNTKRYAVDFIG
jgi:hypothetical protein